MKKSLYIIGMAMLMAVPAPLTAQSKPKAKVDLSFNRSNNDEILEPGYINWIVPTSYKASKTIDGVTFIWSAPEANGCQLRAGWSKSYVQKAEYKAKNGRLTFDGLTLDPRTFGSMTLSIAGLPVGKHSLQTYHNLWENSANFYAAPITATLNGDTVYKFVTPSFDQAEAANACIMSFDINIENAGDTAHITFSTSTENVGEPTAGQKNNFAPPFCNGFELNTVNVALQAKEPYPASGNEHFDADSGSVLMHWTPASAEVTQHLLYIGSDSLRVARMKDATATLAKGDTSYLLQNVYSMETYYWRVDEVDSEGYVTTGKVWYFKPRQLAFPGAEGYGRYAQGGRGGVVYHVTNLSGDRQPGSFLYGLLDLTGPRTIVFDVSGIIDLGFKSIFTPKYVTIAGQTAPGKGICIKGSNINVGSDNICRHMRFKRGYGNTGNALGLSGSDHAIVDHTTAAWGTDETVSGRGAKNVSFQYSIIAEALGIADHKNYATGTNHGYAATIDGKIGSWHHNLLVNCAGRNWSMGGGMDGNNTAIGQMDIFNNVVYNWNKRTTDGNCHEVNFVGNYYKMGPATKHTVLFTQNYENIGSAESTWRAYIKGNIRENLNGTLSTDRLDDTYNVVLSNGDPGPKYQTVVDQPFFESYAKIHSAQDAFKIVLSEAGATMPMRDNQHLRVVKETLNGSYTYTGSRSGLKGEIDHESDAGGFEAYPEEHRDANFDTDQDGMPDWWEALTGSDATVANHNDDPDHDGWTLLEDYLEFMAHPYVVLQPNAKDTVDMAPYFVGFSKKSPVYSIEGSSDNCSLKVDGSKLCIEAGSQKGLAVFYMKVTDSEGATHSKRLSVALTGDVTALPSVWSEDNLDVQKREFFTLDGKQVRELQPQQVYIMRLTDSRQQTQSVKIIAD